MKPNIIFVSLITGVTSLCVAMTSAVADDHAVSGKSERKRVLIDARQSDGLSADYHSSSVPDRAQQSTDSIAASVKLEPIIIRVTGYGAFDTKKKKQKAQKRLMAIRASKLDAYRNLAERVYGYSVTGQSSVKNFSLDQDQYRSSVNSVVRGAKVVSISENPKTGIETILELELPGNFQDCLNRVNNFKYRADCLRPITHLNQETAANLYSGESPKKDNRMRALYHLN